MSIKKSAFQNLPEDLNSNPTFRAEVNSLFDTHTPFGNYAQTLKSQYQENLNTSATYGYEPVVINIIKGKKVESVIPWTNYWSRVRRNHKQFFMNKAIDQDKYNYDFVICSLLANILTINYIPQELLQDELIIAIAYNYVKQNLRIFKYLPKKLQNHPLFLTYVTSLVEAEPLNNQIIRELKNSLVADKFKAYIDRYNLDKESFARSNSHCGETNVVKLCYKAAINSPFASAYKSSSEIEQ